ncbi:MAG: ATP-binding protein [Myxococcota bacterium]
MELQRRELAVRNGALAEEVVQQSGALQQLVAHLNVVRTDERATLARNLHDDLGQLLVGARIELANLERSLGSEGPAENLAHLQRILDGLGASAQRAVAGLRTESDDVRAFSDELQAMLQPIQGRAIPEVRIDVAPDVDGVHEQRETVLRITQEAVTNALKHARASRLSVRLWRCGDRLNLTIEDDGEGFDPSGTARGFGLVGMRERAENERGTLDVESSQRGTLVRCSLPIQRKSVAS